MKKLYAAILLAFMLLAKNALSQQQPLTNAAGKQALSGLSSKLDASYRTNLKKALGMARKKGWLTYKKKLGGTIVSLQGLTPLGFPLYLTTYNNIVAAATTQTNAVQPGGNLGLNLTGSTAALNGKLAIWDGGAIYTAHQEFAGKTITVKDGTTTISDHSTHVAGTMIAKGVYAPARGMAFGATTLQSYDFNNDAAEMALAAPNLLVSNHSYGFITGWNYNDAQSRWEWYGLPGDNEDYRFGFYDESAQAFDQIAFNAPHYLIVQSAGNNRGETGPAVGATYYGFTSRTDNTLINKGPRPSSISSNNGYDIISTTATAKNTLTIGAVNALPNGPAAAADVQISYFSSWGPTDDGRVKPDVCGDGQNVLSTGVTAADAYLTESGTSMAAANVSGSLYLLQEYYNQKNPGNFMLSATLKGLVCHTAFDAGNPGPDYIYGWGLLDMNKAAQVITDNGTKSILSEKILTQGQTQTYNVVASGSGPLKATITWTDPAGTPSAGGTINNRTLKLVNDLDIKISDGANAFQPWVLNPDNPSANAVTGNNSRDNVEQVYIANAVPGKSYTITISHKGTLTNGAQAYSLIVTGVGGSSYCASAPTSDADSRINNVTLADLSNTPPAGCTTYTDYTGLTATLEQGKTYPLSITAGTCGANFNKIIKVYFDWNNNGNFTDAGELAATSGVIGGAGTFVANITVPATVVPGNAGIMRIVLAETSDAATISPCGSYAKGETQDYKVNFVRASIDAGVTAINTPAASGTCPGDNSSVSVHLKNFSTAAISNIPVTVTITPATGGVTKLDEIYTGTLSPLAEADFNLTGTFIATPGTSYIITATTTLAADLVTANNQVTATTVVGISPVINNAAAAYCTDAKVYNLSAAGDGQVFWYRNLTDALPFTTGAAVNTTTPPVNNTYYAGLNDFSGNVGPAVKSVFTTGGYNQFTPSVYFATKAPVLIQSARLYVGNAGKVTFTVTTPAGQIVTANTINVAATRTTAAAGAQTDDPNDQGQVYNLNLAIPAAGNYIISVTYPDNATLYRSSAGVTGYPFSIGNTFAITGNSATSGTDTTYYKSFYYYFYNLHIQSLGCASASRVAVTVTKPTITLTRFNLTSNFASGNQWYLNGTLIPGATGQTYVPLVTGVYRVYVTTNAGCASGSDDFNLSAPVITQNGGMLSSSYNTGNQWYQHGSLITGATSQTYMSPYSGFYEVYVTLPTGFVIKSADFNFVLPEKDNNIGSDISLAVFPVPSSGLVKLAFNAVNNGQLTITLINTIGQTVYKTAKAIPAGGYYQEIDLSALVNGSYYMRLNIGNKTYVRKILIIK